MNILDWLQNGDPAVARLTRKYLLDKNPGYTERGWINDFLDRFDPVTKRWGNGIYGPKWISTFYTMRDLQSLEIDPAHTLYQQGLDTLLQKMWNQDTSVKRDQCVVAMFIGLLTYGGRSGEIVDSMIDYLLRTQLADGGWNCESIASGSQKSSIHTTLSVLEAYADYERSGITSRLAQIRAQTGPAQEYLLRKHLLRRETDHALILPYITQFHFPTRWKYDVLRALLYFSSVGYPFDERMAEAVQLLETRLSQGGLTKGTTYSGLLHFKMETGRLGRMNTLRGLRAIKFYNPVLFQTMLAMPVPEKEA